MAGKLQLRPFNDNQCHGRIRGVALQSFALKHLTKAPFCQMRRSLTLYPKSLFGEYLQSQAEASVTCA